MIRTDLVIESFDAKKLDEIGGLRQKEEEFGGIKITRVSIESKEGERRTGKPKGDYVTVQVPPLGENPGHSDEETEKIAGELAKLLPETGDVLVAGLGNAGITPDAVGHLTCEKEIATRHMPTHYAGNQAPAAGFCRDSGHLLAAGGGGAGAGSVGADGD